MKAEQFVGYLEKVRQTGPARWQACCPAHPDKHPSLGVTEGDDGRVLVKCFAGCGIESIVNAVGLTLSDIMPERLPDHRYKPLRKPFPAADVLEMLRTEVTIVWIAACDIAKGGTLTADEKARIDTAASRIEVAING